MGLRKEIILENGVAVNYHRIVSINKITNISNIIEVASYTSEQKRQEEKEAINENSKMNIYISTQFLTKEYSPNETIEQSYEYLKSLEMFVDAENI